MTRTGASAYFWFLEAPADAVPDPSDSACSHTEENAHAYTQAWRTPKPADYLTIPEAARLFGYCSPSTLRKAAQDGKLRHLRAGPRAILTTEEWVLDWEMEHDGRGRPRGLGRF